MKRLFKGLLIIILGFLFIINLYAEGENNSEKASNCDDAKYKTAEAKKACKTIDSYCFGNSGVDTSNLKGCFYDKNDTLYTKASITSTGFYWNLFTVSYYNVQLTKYYYGLESNGNILFAGCYKIHDNGNVLANRGQFENFGGDVYLFKIIELKNGKCGYVHGDIVPSKGMQKSVMPWGGAPYATYDGRNAVGGDEITFNWTAETGGECPLKFSTTVNAKGYTSSKNKYIFADTDIELINNVVAAFDNITYEQVVGCTGDDFAAYKKAIKCYDDGIAEINNISCPADLSDKTSFSNKLNEIANKCNKDLGTMYKVDTLESLAKEFTNKLSDAVKQKISSCQKTNCNLTEEETKKLEEAMKGKIFEFGCSDLVGKDNYGRCKSALGDFYKNESGLSTEKINCLLNTQSQADDTSSQLSDETEDTESQWAEDTNTENQDSLYNFGGQGIFYGAMNERPIDDTEATCKEVLGNNVVKIVKSSINILRVAGAIIALLNAMITLIPAVVSKDADGLKKAGRKCVIMAVVLAVIGIFPSIMRLIGGIFGYDLSCIV